MRYVNTVFSQFLSEIPRHLFNKVVARHDGDKRKGSMKCWTQFCVILYGQLSSKRTLRDMCLSWQSQAHLQYHFGASEAACSTLLDANRSRPSAIEVKLLAWENIVIPSAVEESLLGCVFQGFSIPLCFSRNDRYEPVFLWRESIVNDGFTLFRQVFSFFMAPYFTPKPSSSKVTTTAPSAVL